MSNTSPSSIGRPLTPAPGVANPEMRIARFRSAGGWLLWPALLVIAVSGATGYFTDNLPAPFVDWMLWAAAGLVLLVLVIVPYLRWLERRYTITTRRVIAHSGLFGRRTRELTHVRGYTITPRRSLWQRLGGTGSLVLDDGVDAPIVLRSIRDRALVQEVLVDQVEINQILAHRDGHSLPQVPPVPPLPQ